MHSAAAEPLPLDRCDARAVNTDRCELCAATVERRGAGRPRRYCRACETVGKALVALRAALEASPAAIVGVFEQLEAVNIPRGTLDDSGARRLRAACFVIGSRGRKLAPGSSGRYTHRPLPPSPASVGDSPELAPAAPFER